MLMEVDFWPVIWNVLSLRVFFFIIIINFFGHKESFLHNCVVQGVCLSERECILTRSYSYA